MDISTHIIAISSQSSHRGKITNVIHTLFFLTGPWPMVFLCLENHSNLVHVFKSTYLLRPTSNATAPTQPACLLSSQSQLSFGHSQQFWQIHSALYFVLLQGILDGKDSICPHFPTQKRPEHSAGTC